MHLITDILKYRAAHAKLCGLAEIDMHGRTWRDMARAYAVMVDGRPSLERFSASPWFMLMLFPIAGVRELFAAMLIKVRERWIS